MAQLSRPFQIALVAVCLLAGIWLFALQGHNSSTSASSTTAASAPSSPAPATTTPAHSASTGVAGSNATAPGVAGLSRAVAKAHQTVTSSQQSAKQVEGESAGSPQSPAAGAPTTSAAAQSSKAAAPTATKVTSVTTVHKTATGKTTVHKVTTVHTTPSKSGAAATPARQRTVEAALAKGDVVVILFWNHHGADDVAVQRALKPLSKAARKISVQEASAKQVASFGSVTRGVQVYGTPTILIVDKRGQTTMLTGLQDTYSISQAIAEAR